jgi:hypothetical protein
MTESNIEDTEHMPQTPDHSWVVVGFSGEPQGKLWLEQNTPESILSFLTEVAKRLAAEDEHWGYVQSEGMERAAVMLPNHQRVSADTVMYDTTHQAVHIIKNALEHGKDASPHWVLLPGVADRQWYPTAPEGDGL